MFNEENRTVQETVSASPKQNEKKRKIHKIPEGGILLQRSSADKVIFTIAFIVLVVHCVTLFVPILWMFVSSFKDKFEYLDAVNKFSLPAQGWEFVNYIEAITEMSLDDNTSYLTMIINSVWYTGLGSFFTVFMPTMTGYLLSKYRFKGRDFIYGLAITLMMIPIVGTSGANMKFSADLGIYNTPWYVVYSTIGCGLGGHFLVYYGFFKSVSWSYAEAVQVDGGGHFTIFFRIMLPQALPIMMTFAITDSIARWNSYEPILMYLPDWHTLASGLYAFQAVMRRFQDWPVYFAGLIWSIIPPVIIFIIFSGKIMQSISVGGLKG